MSHDITIRDIESVPPHVYSWQDETELPRRVIRCRERQPLSLGDAVPPWMETGVAGQPFDFTAAMTALVDVVCCNVAEFAHIRPRQLLIGMVPSRNNRKSGLQARITPLRFAGGNLVKQARGRFFQVQQFRVGGDEILYIVAFSVPRFMNQSFDEKCVTVFHELYHIGPRFDGDLRRHQGRCAYHTHSKTKYDEHMAKLVRAYLSNDSNPRLHDFLRLNAAQLLQRHGQIVGVRAPRAKILPVTHELAQACRAT